LKQNAGIGLCAENVSMAKRSVSWAMFVNIVIVPTIIGLVLEFTGIFARGTTTGYKTAIENIW